MPRYVRWIVCAVIVLAGGATHASAQTACDRACLRTMLDQYLAAVVEHDPSATPLVVGFRQTENGINVRPGKDVWKTVTGLGKVQRRYLDRGTVNMGRNREPRTWNGTGTLHTNMEPGTWNSERQYSAGKRAQR